MRKLHATLKIIIDEDSFRKSANSKIKMEAACTGRTKIEVKISQSIK